MTDSRAPWRRDAGGRWGEGRWSPFCPISDCQLPRRPRISAPGWGWRVCVSLLPGRRQLALDPPGACPAEFGCPGDATPGTTLWRMFRGGLGEGGGLPVRDDTVLVLPPLQRVPAASNGKEIGGAGARRPGMAGGRRKQGGEAGSESKRLLEMIGGGCKGYVACVFPLPRPPHGS